MEELPELPFEQILSCLSLGDLLHCRAVSRRWYHKINSWRVKSLCYSGRLNAVFNNYHNFYKNSRLVSGMFAQNFISSTQFRKFFDTFGASVLSNLKNLRLCELRLNDRTTLAQTLSSFAQLEELALFDVRSDSAIDLHLNLPALKSIHLDTLKGINKLTLDAPRMIKVKAYLDPSLSVELVHSESVERLITNHLKHFQVKQLQNVRSLFISGFRNINSTFLSNWERLKQIHVHYPADVRELFEQKQRYGRADLEIYAMSFLQDAPDLPKITGSDHFEFILGSASSRLADEVPMIIGITYNSIERIAPGFEINFMSRFSDLIWINVWLPVEDIERLLEVLKNCTVVGLKFHPCDLPQELFDRLPEHGTIQMLVISEGIASDFRFVFKLKRLVYLQLFDSVDDEFVRQVLEELELLLWFGFKYGDQKVEIKIDRPRRFEVSVGGRETTVRYPEAAVQFIIQNANNDIR